MESTSDDVPTECTSPLAAKEESKRRRRISLYPVYDITKQELTELMDEKAECLVYESSVTAKNFQLVCMELAREDYPDDLTLFRTQYDKYALSSAAEYASQHHYDQLASVHFAAVMLNPTTKRMTKFSDRERQKARDYIDHLATKIEFIPCTTSVAERGNIYDDDSDDDTSPSCEMQRYLSEKVDKNEDLCEYWPARRHAYPLLYKVAKIVFSILPSEAICERAFSRCSYVIDKSRYNLKAENVEWIVNGCNILDICPEFLQ